MHFLSYFFSHVSLHTFYIHTIATSGMYCTAGKDRTGIITMLTLHVLGATDEEVLVDIIHPSHILQNALTPCEAFRCSHLDFSDTNTLSFVFSHPLCENRLWRIMFYQMLPTKISTIKKPWWVKQYIGLSHITHLLLRHIINTLLIFITHSLDINS